MAKFRKKPVVIEATHLSQVDAEWIEARRAEGHSLELDGDDLIIETLEGQMRASPGDWVIQGVKGEIYPCKPDIFEATYEFVNEGMSFDQFKRWRDGLPMSINA